MPAKTPPRNAKPPPWWPRGQADAQLGRIISGAGKDLTEIAIQAQRRQNQGIADTEFQNAKMELDRIRTGAETYAGEGASDGSDYLSRYTANFAEGREKLFAEISNQDARQAAVRHSGDVERFGARQVRANQARQKSVWSRQQLDIRTARRQQSIAGKRGVEQQQGLAEANADFAEQQRLGNITNAQGRISALRIWAQASITTDAQANPDGAKAFMEDGDYDHLFANDFERTKSATLIDGARHSLRAVEAGEVRELRQQDLAMIRTTGRGLPGMDRRLDRLGDETLRDTHNLRRAGATSEYDVGQRIQLLPPNEATEVVETLALKPGRTATALDQARYDGAKAAHRKWQKDLETDPMAAVKRSPLVKTLPQAVGAQKHAGVAYPSVFTRAEAALQGDIYRNARGEGRIDATNQALAPTGAYRGLAIWNLLSSNPLPSAPMTALHGQNPAMTAILKQLLAAEEKGRTELEKGRTESQIAEVTAAVDERLAPFARTAAPATADGRDEVAIAEQTRDGIYVYALDLMAAGRSPAGAAKSAADKLINEHYSFTDTYRVPKAHDAAPIQAYTDAALAERHGDGAAAELDPAEWRNTPDGTGLMLVDATGGQIIDGDNEPIRATFEEAAAKGLDASATNAEDPNEAHIKGPNGKERIRFAFNGDESELQNLFSGEAADENAALSVSSSDQGSQPSANNETEPKPTELASEGSGGFGIISEAEAMPALVPYVAAAVVAAVRVGARYLLPRLAQAARARLGLTMRQRAAQLFQESGRPKIQISVEDLVGSDVSDGDVMAAFADQAIGGSLTPGINDNSMEITFGPVSNDWAARVKTGTGLDVSGYVRSVDTDNLRHSHNKHGVGREKTKGQVPVTGDDYALVPTVIEDFDDIILRPAKGARPASITFSKRFNGNIIVVETVRTKARRLTFKSMWKKKN